jgi:hypothetical protein
MFPVFSLQRFKELIEGAGKQREVWEVFVPQASGFDETPGTVNEIKVGGIGWNVKQLHVEGVCHFHNQSAPLVTGIVITSVISSPGYVALIFSRSSQTTSALIDSTVLRLTKSWSRVSTEPRTL